MEKLQIAAGVVALLLVTMAVLKWSTKTDDLEEGCECQKIRRLYGANPETQEHYWYLVGRIQDAGEGVEEAERELFQRVRHLRNHPACYVSRGDVELKIAFCSVWPGVEAKAREQGWDVQRGE